METNKFDRYDGFDRLDEAIKKREELREKAELLKRRTWSGYIKNVKQIGKKDFIDKEWDRKLFEHREEIQQFYKEHPELGKAKQND